MGNVLRGDDGFGAAVLRRMSERGGLPPQVRAVDVGIGGIPLVQELLDGYECLVIVDAARRGKAPGTLMTLRPAVPDVTVAPAVDVAGIIGDPHTTNPSRVLLLARVLGVLPREVVILGCEPLTHDDDLQLGLSEPVAAAVDAAVDRVLALARHWTAGAAARPEGPPTAPTRPAGNSP
jgi:hydrogenase maturation protease